MPDSEQQIKAAIRKHFGTNPDIRLFTNPCGVGWMGSMVVKKDDMILLKQPRRVDFGLVQGSADLVGWHTLEIKPEHVGMKIARFLSIEVKTATGQPTDAQKIWHANVLKAGGASGIVRSVEEAEEILK